MSQLARFEGLLLALSLSACSGGGANPTGTDGGHGGPSPVELPDAGVPDGGPPSLRASALDGHLSLPTGFATALSSLKVLSVGGQATPDGAGHFSVAGAGAALQGLLVLGPAAEPVLMGFAKAGQTATLSARSTAAYLLFVFGGGAFLPVDSWERAAQLLSDAPMTTVLARFLEERLAANPRFLALSDAADRTSLARAIAAGLESLIPSAGHSSQGLVLVNPEDEKSGITLFVGDREGHATADVNQITFMNSWRRRVWAFIERKTGTASTDYTAEADFELPPTNGTNNVIGSAVDVLYGNGAYAPVYYGPVGLGTVQSEDETLRYRVRVVGAGSETGLPLTPAQEEKRRFVFVKAVILDLFVPVLYNFIPHDLVGAVYGSPFFAEFVKVVVNQAYSGGLIEFGNLVSVGDLWGAVTKLATVLQNNTASRDWFIGAFNDLVLSKVLPSASAQQFLRSFSGALLKALAIADQIVAAADLYAVVSDARKANNAEDWYVTVRAPKVLLSPGFSKLTCGERVGLGVTVKNAGQSLGGNLIYAFESTAKAGHLTTSVNSTYKDNFEATNGEVTYTVNPGLVLEPITDVITVKVYALTPTGPAGRTARQYLGKATAEVEVGRTCESTAGYVGNGEVYRSGCTGVLSAPSAVQPGDEISVTVRAGYGGVCGTPYVFMSHAVSARLDDLAESRGGYSGSVYDFCYGGGPQPIVAGGAGVAIPDGETHTVFFKIDPALQCPVCVREDPRGEACWSNPGNHQTVRGPAVVMGGSGGTHGWSTVQFFEIGVP